MARAKAADDDAEAFASPLRGDTCQCKFQSPSAGVISNKHNGSVSYGLGDKPTRRIISHAFALKKEQQNLAALDRIAAVPSGQRWAAAAEWQQQHQLQREKQEQQEEQLKLKHEQDSVAGVLHQLGEYQASSLNPLRPQTPADTSAEAGSQQDQEQQQRSRCSSPGPAEHQRAHNLEGHLATGSLEPKAAAAGSGSEAAAAELRSNIQAAVDERVKQLQELDELAQQLMLDYPHGIPKKKLLELRRRGLELPGVGFGCSPAAGRTAACGSSAWI